MRSALIVAVLAAAAAPATTAAQPPAPRPVPMVLPGEASAAQSSHWILGARPGSAPIERRFGAERIGGAFVVPRGRARALARELGDRLLWAEPDAPRRFVQAPPADPVATPWRDRVVPDARQPPAVTADTPLLAVVDTPIDPAHPEFASGNVAGTPGRAANDLHGTATTAVAVAARNGVGITGVFPGAPARNVALPPEPFSCADSARGIDRAVSAGAAVINMSYVSPSFCYLEYRSLQRAVKRGVSLVAAAGNDFAAGNPLEFPASLPHVITVAALGAGDAPASFSNTSAAVDLAAPGEGVATAVPVRFDEDGVADGYMQLDGTSFAAPMVAGAVQWVRAARPELSADQVAQVVRLGARDIGAKGWQADTGFGILDVGRSLDRATPPRDHSEPNDEIEWVDGRRFDRPNRAVSKGGSKTLRALIDRFEDPVDVYRVRIPARRVMRISTDPTFGDPDLQVIAGRARDLGEEDRYIADSTRNGLRTDSVRVRNRSRRMRTAYVAVYIDDDTRGLDAYYTLRIRRG